MTEPDTPRPPRRFSRTHAEYRWTEAKAIAFLRALVTTGSVSKAARSVGMSRQSAYNLRGRLSRADGPAFAGLWDQALAYAHSRRGAEAVARMDAPRREECAS